MTIIEIAPPAPQPEPGAPAPVPGWRMPWVALVIAVVAFLGVGVLVYPAAASWFTQYQQSQEIVALSDGVRDLEPDARQQAIRAALDYNQSLTGGASVGANERKPRADDSVDAADDEYNELLKADVTGLIGRIKIPAIAADLPIYHGTDDDILNRGVGHLQGTALPVGGDSTQSVLTAHRGLASAELFTHLDRVAIGDTLTIEVFGEVLTYRVIETKVVQPSETETLHPQRGADLVTLVTCTPLGINSHRILVTAERILPTPIGELAVAGAAPQVPGFAWWAVLMFGAAMTLAGYVYVSGRQRPAGAVRSPEEPTPDPVLIQDGWALSLPGDPPVLVDRSPSGNHPKT